MEVEEKPNDRITRYHVHPTDGVIIFIELELRGEIITELIIKLSDESIQMDGLISELKGRSLFESKLIIENLSGAGNVYLELRKWFGKFCRDYIEPLPKYRGKLP